MKTLRIRNQKSRRESRAKKRKQNKKGIPNVNSTDFCESGNKMNKHIWIKWQLLFFTCPQRSNLAAAPLAPN